MRVGKRLKQKLKVIPRSHYEYTKNGEVISRSIPRKNAVYFRYYCCQGCYFDWGRWFEKRYMYKHEFGYANYMGILKKYWDNYKVDYGSNDYYETT